DLSIKLSEAASNAGTEMNAQVSKVKEQNELLNEFKI
ncbi:methyl-accepting chemotaxis domain protein, partial [Vibrio cholerae HC-48A1]